MEMDKSWNGCSTIYTINSHDQKSQEGSDGDLLIVRGEILFYSMLEEW